MSLHISCQVSCYFARRTTFGRGVDLLISSYLCCPVALGSLFAGRAAVAVATAPDGGGAGAGAGAATEKFLGAWTDGRGGGCLCFSLS